MASAGSFQRCGVLSRSYSRDVKHCPELIALLDLTGVISFQMKIACKAAFGVEEINLVLLHFALVIG